MRHRFDSRLTSGPSPLSGVTDVDADEATWADDGGRTMELLPRESPTFGLLGPLDVLYARHDALAEGRAPGDSTAVHNAILERLAANRLIAEARGWTSCALERVAGMGRLRLWGVPPADRGRAVVPDWTRDEEMTSTGPADAVRVE
jgi:hypothetical protein